MVLTADVARLLQQRVAVAADPALRGRAACTALAQATDEWLGALLDIATGGETDGLALVAAGGYGRLELAPASDLDVWLLHDGRKDVDRLAERLWYPVWDAGLKLGHAVRTHRQAVALLGEDLDTATAGLSARHVAGDAAVTGRLAEEALASWRKRSSRWMGELLDRVARRHELAGEVAFLLEPDLKEGRGGLRDIHALRWAEAARPVMLEGDAAALTAAEDVLLEVRVALHRVSTKASDDLLLDRQDDVAKALGGGDADMLMARVSAAARSVAWVSDEAWRRVAASSGKRRRFRRDEDLSGGLVVRDGEIHLDSNADPVHDPLLALRAGVAAAERGLPIDRATLVRLGDSAPPLSHPWPEGAREALVDLLAAGRAAIPVLEALDQRRIFERVLPEWAPVRSKPQRNALHRYTVDRHLVETVAIAARLCNTVPRPDLLLIGALLHDLGKGYPGDHTDVGVELVTTIGPRMGFSASDVDVLVKMVRHHLLLPDVATRRDLSDPAVIEAVAADVGSIATLELLAALAEADGSATGPSAWGPWKAELVGQLVERVAHVLRGGDAGELTRLSTFPDQGVLELMSQGRTVVRAHPPLFTVVAPDRPGLFSRVAGALALEGLAVVAADAHSEDGMASSRFRVETDGPVDWEKIAAVVRRAIEGQLAIDARLALRARTYRRSPSAMRLVDEPSVRVDPHASASSTIVEVRAPDRVGVLYRITRALADLDLDIRMAKVSTLGHEVVDTFYVRTATGGKLQDREHVKELEVAILHQLSLLGSS